MDTGMVIIEENIIEVCMGDKGSLIGFVLLEISSPEAKKARVEAKFFSLGLRESGSPRINWEERTFSTSNSYIPCSRVEPCIRKDLREVVFTFDIVINPRNRGIGTYLISKVIEWLKKHYSDYPVWVKLSPHDAEDKNNRILRNEFYKKLGFKLNEREASGHCERVDKLSSGWNEAKVKEIPVRKWLIGYGKEAEETIAEYKGRNESLRLECKYQEERANRLVRQKARYQGLALALGLTILAFIVNVLIRSG